MAIPTPLPAIISHIVSQGRVCTPGSQNPIEFCNVQTSGLVKEEPTFEISNTFYINPNYFRTLLAFVAEDSTWGGRSSDELYGRPQYANETLEEGQAAYLAFTATLTCFEGTLCHAEGNITEPTNARACFPSLNGVSYTDEMNGTTSLVTTNEETAWDVGGNPAVETEYDYLESMEPDNEGVAGALDVELAKRYAVFMLSIATFVFLGF